MLTLPNIAARTGCCSDYTIYILCIRPNDAGCSEIMPNPFTDSISSSVKCNQQSEWGVWGLSSFSGSFRKLPVNLATSLRGNAFFVQYVCVSVCACYRWTPRGQALWSWTAYRDKLLLLTVRCTSLYSPLSSRNFQVIKSNPQAHPSMAFNVCLSWQPVFEALCRPGGMCLYV